MLERPHLGKEQAGGKRGYDGLDEVCLSQPLLYPSYLIGCIRLPLSLVSQSSMEMEPQSDATAIINAAVQDAIH